MRRISFILVFIMIFSLTACTVTINGKKVEPLSWDFDGKPLEKTEVVTERIASQSRLSVSNVGGKTVLIPSEDDVLRVTAVKRLNAATDKDKLEKMINNDLQLNVQKNSSGFDISVKYISGVWSFIQQSVDIEILVPKSFINVSVRSASGDIDVSNLKDMEDINISTVSGHVNAEGIYSQRYEVGSTSGDMRIYDVQGRGNIHTVSGDMEVSKITGTTQFKTTSGDIKAYDFDGDINYTSVSGKIDLSCKSLRSSSFHSTSGEISIAASDIDSTGNYRFNSVSGDVTLTIPENAGFNIDVNTVSGKIENEFGTDSYDRNNRRPGKSVKETIGSGGADFNIHTTSGDVIILKQKAG